MPQLTIEVAGRTAELLLVEDNYGDVVLTREAFLSAKIQNNIAVARDGEEALSILMREGPHFGAARPDLILLDLNLPCLDGYEVLQAVKSNPALKKIPVVMLTSSDAEIDVEQCYKLNANGYIVKPIDLGRLQEIVKSIESFWFSVVVLPQSSASGQTSEA
jgi:CheY-like chemotaxis protein